MRYVDSPTFPPDTIWQDYFQIETFIPKPGAVIIDVGANIGDWTVIVGKHFGAQVLAIEPAKSAFEYLTKNIEINSLQSTVTSVNCALGDHVGVINLEYDDRTGYVNPMSSQHPELAEEHYNQYRLDTMDNIIQNTHLDSIDLIKIDVEGSELDVLKGCDRTIAKFRPKIIVEVHSYSLREYVLAFLMKYGYDLRLEKINYFGFMSELYISVLYLEHS